MARIPGKFVWFEHVSKEPKKAQAFYGEVLGWKIEGAPMGDSTYEMIKVGDATIGGYARPQGGEAAHWISYVSCDDVDATAKKVVAAGGTLLGEAFDIPTVGRMQRVADPYGAHLNLFRGAEPNDAPDVKKRPVGHVDWNELLTPEPAKAVAFYEKILGYTHDAMAMKDGEYLILNAGGAPRGGVMKTPVPRLPAHWIQYVVVDDCDAAVARATRGGGELKMPPSDVPNIGRFAVMTDPLGAPFGVIKPA